MTQISNCFYTLFILLSLFIVAARGITRMNEPVPTFIPCKYTSDCPENTCWPPRKPRCIEQYCNCV
ncbi:putative Late nodulin [Medicago truncatula]|uniref:Putative Late nodulin n=1 Tax=Medicago truncatula TaxID=3880 RepID=A0A396I7S4_MEDTR|nr:putative Late nodulin [Medicago truncatula]